MYADARKQVGLSREEAAFRVHSSPRALANYESGQTMPPPDVVASMAVEYKAPELVQEYCRECPIGQKYAYDYLNGVNSDMSSVLLSLQQEAVEAVDKLATLERLARNKAGRQDFTPEEWTMFAGAIGEWLDLEHNIEMLRLSLGRWCDTADLIEQHNQKCRSRGYTRSQGARKEVAA